MATPLEIGGQVMDEQAQSQEWASTVSQGTGWDEFIMQ